MCHPTAPLEMKRQLIVVPQRQTRAATQCFEFSPHIVVIQDPGNIGSRHGCFPAGWALCRFVPAPRWWDPVLIESPPPVEAAFESVYVCGPKPTERSQPRGCRMDQRRSG
jgi:hypothetical protein